MTVVGVVGLVFGVQGTEGGAPEHAAPKDTQADSKLLSQVSPNQGTTLRHMPYFAGELADSLLTRNPPAAQLGRSQATSL
ncbi:uncharacterized protein K441DRAFT_278290 [Cenococcum geophilum 1.58]|uniref:uncharacterized protein n=1 Tax=Cenococcum geophilum 1.58 TaxID=794803 RepID=UPI00358ED366|nr:hypothetical protein K441DRAFT_278290 [Cenococcum geophilum 1.58]